MSFNIQLDYRFDSTGFFNDPVRRAAMEEAARIWESFIQDEFPDVPAGVSFTIANPSNSAMTETITLTDPIDDLLIFVGAEALGGSLGRAGFDGSDAAGDIFSARISGNFRGTGPVTNFEPWVGVARFDPNVAWSFDLAGPVAGFNDFLSVAVHEIGHILGVGTSAIFDQLGATGVFDAFNARAVNGGNPIPLESDLGHVLDGFRNGTVVMDPTIQIGTRKLPTNIDLALLSDIGYEIAGFTPQGGTPAITTNGDDVTVFGTIVGDRIDGMGGNDAIQGDAGDDTLRGGAGNDTLFGQSGDDTFVVESGDGANTIGDFDETSEIIEVVESGFSSVADLVAAISKPFSNVSRIIYTDGTSIDVFHASSQAGTPLTAANFAFDQTGSGALTGGPNDDTLTGAAGNDTLTGLDGDDILNGGAGADTLDGGSGFDTADYLGGSVGVFADLINGGQSGDAAGDVYTGIEALGGTVHGDDLRGTNGANTLIGSGGNDFLLGRGGNDLLIGGAGNDTLAGGSENDILSGGDGNDRSSGGAGNDRHVGGAGSDTMIGGGGDDTMIGGGGDDTVFDGRGASRLFGGGQNDRLIGVGGNDELNGGNGQDTLNGGNGIDRLAGEGGNDFIIGGGGADIFVFRSGMGADRVGDHVIGTDRLFIEAALAGSADPVAVAGMATLVGNDAVFDFGGGNTLTLLGLGTTTGLAGDITVI